MQLYLKYTSYFSSSTQSKNYIVITHLWSNVLLQHITISLNYVPLETKTRMSWESGDSDLLFFTVLGKSD